MSDKVEDFRQQCLEEQIGDAAEVARVTEDTKPGTLSFHELLHSVYIAVNLFEAECLMHPACLCNPKLFADAEKVHTAIMSLYNVVGDLHMGEHPNPEQAKEWTRHSNTLDSALDSQDDAE